jgi:adenylate kinase
MYHVSTLPPKKEGVCDICSSGLIQRDDDRPEVIQRRLEVYDRQTAPLVEFYDRSERLDRVDAAVGPDQVYRSLAQLLEPYKAVTS